MRIYKANSLYSLVLLKNGTVGTNLEYIIAGQHKILMKEDNGYQ
tara:strand:+ start:410 stop:541 length:132 start_codon:yes stop_codon:yes gene_type:complete